MTDKSSRAPTPGPQAMPTITGHLSKWANYIKGWKKRYCILEAPGVLVYFSKKPKGSSGLNKTNRSYRGSIVLQNAKVIPHPKNKRRFTLQSDKGQFYFKAPTAGELQRWTKAINDAKAFFASAAAKNFSVVELSDGNVEVASSTDDEDDLIEKRKKRDTEKHSSEKKYVELISLGDLISQAELKSETLVKEAAELESEAARSANGSHIAHRATTLKNTSHALMGAVQKCLDALGAEVERRLRLEVMVSDLRTKVTQLKRNIAPEAPPPDEENDDFDSPEITDDSTNEGEFFDAQESLNRSQSFIAQQMREEQQRSQRANNNSQYADRSPSSQVMTGAPAPATRSPSTQIAAAPPVLGVVPKISWRTRLPAPKASKKDSGTSLWSLLKNAIGKDLSKITLPAYYNEPLTVTQRGAEEMESLHLLLRATTEDDSRKRMALVAAWAMSAYHATVDRTGKPFNPMLGETYEWDRQADMGCRFFAEQVSHHPPITAYHLTGPDFVFYGDSQIKNKFWGNSVEVFPTGTFHLLIGKYKDHYSWSKVTTCIHNLFASKLYIDNYGEMVITNHRTGEVATMNFIKKGWLKGQYELVGSIEEPNGNTYRDLIGHWNAALYALPPADEETRKARRKDKDWDPAREPGVEVLFRAPPKPEYCKDYYNLTVHAMALNELPPEMEPWLAPSDARFRPDQRALENGDLKRATDEKLRLEEKQRAARRVRESQGEEWTPKWFVRKTDPETQTNGWVFTGEYWDCRARKDWSRCPDIW